VNTKPWMIYGANGYTGQLIAREAVQQGMRPLLAGRSAAKLTPLAKELACDYRSFALTTATEVASQLKDMALVLHCAGSFSATSALIGLSPGTAKTAIEGLGQDHRHSHH
jgi:short subunit dehydrogenase-like uncharacterized protein